MLKNILRKYTSIPGYKTSIVSNFEEHYAWMNENKPQQAVLYFKNDWNPECSRQFQKDFLTLFQHEEAFSTFIVECFTAQGDRTKKYYSLRYEPTILFLSDGFELKKSIGGDIQALKADLERVKLFRKKLKWDLGLNGGTEVWENHHDQYMRKWTEFNEQQALMSEGTLMFDRN